MAFYEIWAGEMFFIVDWKPCSAWVSCLPKGVLACHQIVIWIASISPMYFPCLIVNKLSLFDPINPFAKYL